jgi:hypothetical protein
MVQRSFTGGPGDHRFISAQHPIELDVCIAAISLF